MSNGANRKRKVLAKEDVSHEGELNGLLVEVDEEGSVVSCSTRGVRDEDRWENNMPSFERFPCLRELDLFKSRYIQTVHESTCQLEHLTTLRLTRCSRLRSIPATIGQLQNLEEVSRRFLFVESAVYIHGEELSHLVSVVRPHRLM